MDQFHSFEQLKIHAQEGRDYVVHLRTGTTGIAIVAPHGGSIEPGTAAIADAIAGSDHSYYAFKGIRPEGNAKLHIASVRFDEPRALALVRNSHTVVTVHGCRGASALVYVGGRDQTLKQTIIESLVHAGIKAENSPEPRMAGIHSDNLCNRGSRGEGVQLEITGALRRRMMMFKRVHHPKGCNPLFGSLVGVIRAALSDTFGPPQISAQKASLTCSLF